MTTLLVIVVSACGLLILGYRAIMVVTCPWNQFGRALKRFMLDWGLALGLAYIGGITGGVVGGSAGLVAGPFLSLWIGFK